MAKISLKQVVHNIKEKYVSATGDTSEITYSNIDDKVYNMPKLFNATIPISLIGDCLMSSGEAEKNA